MGGLVDINLVSTGVRTLAMLFVVLALLLITLYLFKRFSTYRGNAGGEVSIKTLSSLSLSTKDKLQVVEIEGEKIVVGVSPGGINFITKIKTASQRVDELRQTEHENNI
jgi:flagellar protein FliO/FliZ